MRTITRLVVVLGLLVFLHSSRSQDAYPIAYNLQFIPNYEYVNSMAMSSDNKEHYSVFIVVFQNKGDQRFPVNDEYEIVTSKGEKHKAGWHPLVKRDIEARRKFSAESTKMKFISPGETKYIVAIFDRVSDETPAFQLRIHGMPDAQATPNKEMIVVDYEHLKNVVERGPATAKDPYLVWEAEPIQYNPNRQVAHWRLKKMQRANEQP